MKSSKSVNVDQSVGQLQIEIVYKFSATENILNVRISRLQLRKIQFFMWNDDYT